MTMDALARRTRLSRMRARSRTALLSLAVCALVLGLLAPAAAAASPETQGAPRWRWPLTGPHTVQVPYRAPAHAYGAGHRGIDLEASVGVVVTSPADGVVAFRGTVVDRPLLTIAHADGLVSTFEPLQSELLAGEAVRAGQAIGLVAVGGHTAPGALHVGVRRDGDYINPMLLFGDVARAVLLPCCRGS